MSVGRQALGAPATTTATASINDDAEVEQPTVANNSSAAMDVSTLTFNLRALNFIDKTLTLVKSKSTTFDNSSPDTVAGSDRKTRSAKLKTDQDLPIISLDEVAWHDTFDDCWLVICDYVYDCTNFMKNHPGGHDVLLEYAGRDATLAFVGTGHSKMAKRLLERYLIGELPVSERIFRTPNGVRVGDYD